MRKVVILEDEPHNRESLMRLIASRDDLEVIAATDNGMECETLCKRLVPDILYADIEVPSRSGLQVAAVAADLGVIVIFTTSYRGYALEAFRIGAAGYLTKPFGNEEFNRVTDRAVILCSSDSREIYGNSETAPTLPSLLKKDYGLTPAQVELCLLVLEGCSRDALAEKLSKSERAVKSLLQGIYQRLLEPNLDIETPLGRKDKYGRLVYCLCRLDR